MPQPVMNAARAQQHTTPHKQQVDQLDYNSTTPWVYLYMLSTTTPAFQAAYLCARASHMS